MPTKYNVLILGASYGSLLGTKLALAGHSVNLVCLPAEADLINREGAIVRLPVKGHNGLVEINSKQLPGKLTAGGTLAFKPADADLVDRWDRRRHTRAVPGSPTHRGERKHLVHRRHEYRDKSRAQP